MRETERRGVQGCVKEKRGGRRREWRDTAWKRQRAHCHTLAYARTSITNQCFTNPNQQIMQEGISSAQPLDMTVHAMRTCRKLRDFHRVHWRILTYPVLLDDFKKAPSKLLNKNINNRIETCSWSVQRTRQTACAS